MKDATECQIHASVNKKQALKIDLPDAHDRIKRKANPTLLKHCLEAKDDDDGPNPHLSVLLYYASVFLVDVFLISNFQL